ncbi:MAG: sensor histidine kinase [Pseudomonadota bacterium]
MRLPDGRRRGLTVRVLLLLSLALLPLGAISIFQTSRIAAQAEAQAEQALLLLTERAANALQARVQRGFGSARGLGLPVLELQDDPAACSAVLVEFLELFPSYSFVGFVNTDGLMTCSSNGEIRDFSGYPAMQETLRDPRPNVVRNDNPPISQEPVVVVTEPIRDAAGTLRGFLSLSVPTGALVPEADAISTESPLTMVTFNHRGEILTGTGDLAVVEDLLPGDRSLSDVVETSAMVFKAPDRNGVIRVYGLVPLLPGVAYALSSWPQDAVLSDGFSRLVATSLLPVLMWAAGLLVAFFALERLVIRHIRVLSRQMRSFAGNRQLSDQPNLPGASEELAEMERDFRDMAYAILRDEATLEDNLREKNILLKEVHHRVKNNLQLITSIMNMQVRRANTTETRAVLGRLLDRVMGLAAVHRALYQSEDMERIEMGSLIEELASQIIVSDPDRRTIHTDIETDPVTLMPDQAVPLSMLASEAMTNAVSHGGPDEGGDLRVEVRLVRTEGDAARLSVVSTLGDAEAWEPRDVGLGAQLMQAFEAQLGGTLEMGRVDGAYRVEITFPVRTVAHETMDY